MLDSSLCGTGQFQEEGITEILMEPGKREGSSGTRNLRDNLSDLRAQVAANNSGIRLLGELVHEYGLKTVEAYMHFIQKNAELSVRHMLKEFAEKNGSTAHAIDFMDDGSPIELTVTIDKETGSAVFDFTGTGPQVRGNHNAPPAVTYSAVIYSLRSMVAARHSSEPRMSGSNQVYYSRIQPLESFFRCRCRRRQRGDVATSR